MHAAPVSPDNLMVLLGKIAGPVDTPYEGGTFYVNIELPRECVVGNGGENGLLQYETCRPLQPGFLVSYPL